MPAAAHRWTRDEVLALPDDGNRYELVDGELLVSPSPRPRHQIALVELLLLLDPYVRTHSLGRVLPAPADLDLRAAQLVQPDLFVGGMVDGGEPVEWEEYGIPILVVEVLSPSTARHDRITKRRLYQRAGVPVYWIVDLDAQVVEVWTPGADRPVIVEDRLVWQPKPGIPPLEIDLHALFSRIDGGPAVK